MFLFGHYPILCDSSPQRITDTRIMRERIRYRVLSDILLLDVISGNGFNNIESYTKQVDTYQHPHDNAKTKRAVLR